MGRRGVRDCGLRIAGCGLGMVRGYLGSAIRKGRLLFGSFLCVASFLMLIGELQAVWAQEGGYGTTLNAVRERGKVRCGGNTASPAFGFLDSEGNTKGYQLILDLDRLENGSS